jgi:hypothetical protein
MTQAVINMRQLQGGQAYGELLKDTNYRTSAPIDFVKSHKKYSRSQANSR